MLLYLLAPWDEVEVMDGAVGSLCLIPQVPQGRVCVAPTSEPISQARGWGRDWGSDRAQREQGQGVQLRFVAALRPALALVYKGKVRSFTGLQLSLAELP